LGFPLPWFIGVILGALLILAFIVFLMIKRLQDSPNRTFAYAANKPPKKTAFSGEPEVFQDDRVPQKTNPLAGYETTQFQSKINTPKVIPERVVLPVPSPDKEFTAPAGAIPRFEGFGTPVPYSGPPVPTGKGEEDNVPGSPMKNLGASPMQAYVPVPSPDTRFTAPPAAPQTEDTGSPVPHSRPPDRFGKGTEHRDGPITRKESRNISLMNFSRKKDTQIYQGPLMLSLFVEDQNTNIGRRNVHTVKSGYSFTIGGGKSDFLIFLVPVPSRIAELRSDGTQCTLIPHKPEFFPDIGSRQVPDCIGKPIRIISERRYELIIRIDRYEDPLITLNRLLHSVDVPGYRQEPG
jgi:hypothetical protein